ncbi:odorant receptor 94a-like [Diabrotica virgifera virgifera]|uniref:Odorant receptor n=1 Tax=Diabrotica virgifera virgifera TaxID=50390 RepID=A0ABM5KRM6_DIAVI|nr:odorant receptor 94a-like [Diabrotica virgifera virgifera]
MLKRLIPDLSFQNINLVDAFDIEKRYLTFGGFYPIQHVSKMSRVCYYIRGSFNFIMSWLEMILIVVYLYTQLSDLIKISEVLLFCMTQSAFVCKLVNFIVYKNNMFIIEKHLQNPLLTYLNKEEEKLVKDYVDNVRILAKIFRILCTGVVLFYGLYPILDHEPGEIKKLPLPVWVPFDTEKYYVYIWFVIMLSLSIGAWTNSNIDILTISLITLATVHTEILKERFRKSAEYTLNTGNRTAIESPKQKIIKCIIHYNAIYSFVLDIEKTFSKGIFVQFLCSVLVICLTGFQMLVISFKSIQFVLLITYLNCMTCQIAMYCWYGHLLMESSNEISDACYSSEWFECDLSSQKMFLTIMERSKYPLILRAANFFTLNLPTLMTILRSSYSYFAVLQHIYSNRIKENI